MAGIFFEASSTSIIEGAEEQLADSYAFRCEVASGANLPLFGMCAISDPPAGSQ